MKRLIFIIFFFFATVLYAEYYKVNVTRINQDLYRDTYSGVYIETMACVEPAYWEDAILKYDELGLDNKLIFQDGAKCDVVRIFR